LSLLARQIRSGVTETSHHGSVAVVDRDGKLVARHGDIDRVFFLRSAAKPFQALVSQESGAGLDPMELAMACASHRGFPVHVALVESMLARAGLDETALQCPPDWPLSPVAAREMHRAGAGSRRRIWHNCSGKHAGFLRACVANGWPIESYLDPDHPLQREIVARVGELGSFPVGPIGVDGCGAPVLRTTARAMATLFGRLATDDDCAQVFGEMHRYPGLIGANGEGDTEIAIVTNSAAKGGAAGCVGVAVHDRLGIGVKSWEGLGSIGNLAAAAALHQLGVLVPTGVDSLGPILRPPVLGGDRVVGHIEAVFYLETI